MLRPRLISSVLTVAIAAVPFSANLLAGIDPEPFRTGLFGVAAGQAIRVSVLNAGTVGGIAPCVIPDLAGFVVTIAGASGRVLFESPHRVLPVGMGTFTDFVPPLEDAATGGARVPGDGALARARRVQLRAAVAVELSPIVDDRCTEQEARRQARRLLRGVHLTLEVFDIASGRTAFTLPFSEVSFNPQPEPPDPTRTPGQ
jgi:hypothetical protein